MTDQFQAWLTEGATELDAIGRAMSVPMEQNAAPLMVQLARCEAHYARLMTLLADANAFLDLRERDAIRAIDHDLTVPERTAEMKAATANERAVRDKLDGLAQAISQRIILGQSLLKALARETAHLG